MKGNSRIASRFEYINRIEESLCADAKDMLKRIYEPVAVAIPLSDSRRDVCIMPDGEIRSYGRLYPTKPFGESGQPAYMSSRDAGISWTLHYAHGRMNSCTYFPERDVYITVSDTYNNNYGLGQGLWMLRSSIGPDDENPEIVQISNDVFIDSFLPQKSEYSNRIWFTSQRNDRSKTFEPVSYCNFFYSDDFGDTWNRVELPPVQECEIAYPDKGIRWSKASGVEPSAIEISEGKMMMIIRTPRDCFYLSYSYDRGESWSDPEPSCFYGTNTTAYLLKLSDGRILNFWNNTRPLPEADHEKTVPPVSDYVKKGISEDTFTNRDAAHVAISDDGGKSFKGYRELILNPSRNNTDFRYVGGSESSADKSVHQFQAFELPYNKILVSVGQNKTSRRLVIFDVNWLYESSARENFIKNALEKITTHTYVKSISDCQVSKVGNGHCAWNRAPSAYLMPDPLGGYGEVLSISKHSDPRMYNDIGGATWNFPMSEKGRVTLEIMIAQKSASIVLSDRWYNTCDETVAQRCPFAFEICKTELGDGFARLEIEYDTVFGVAKAYVNGKELREVTMNGKCDIGLSYVILQCNTEGDSEGFYIRSLEKTAL